MVGTRDDGASAIPVEPEPSRLIEFQRPRAVGLWRAFVASLLASRRVRTSAPSVLVKIFDVNADPRTILLEVIASGIAGIQGGRVAVRSRLREVHAVSAASGQKFIVANSTINLPSTELAYLYDSVRYSDHEAHGLVEQSFNAAHN